MTKVGQEFIIFFFKMSLQDIITILVKKWSVFGKIKFFTVP